MSDVSRLLQSLHAGNPQAAGDLLPLVYEELRQLAAVHVARERPGYSLNATALVHEAWLRLVGDGDRQIWENRRHFFGAAAIAIRRILVDRTGRKTDCGTAGRLSGNPSISINCRMMGWMVRF